MKRAGIFLFASALTITSSPLASAASLTEMETMPAKEVFEYCKPLWELWDGVAPLGTAEQQDIGARCFFYFGSAVMNWCEMRGQEDAIPIKKFVLFWKGFIEAEPKAAEGPFKATLVGALVGADLCAKPSQKPAKAKRTG